MASEVSRPKKSQCKLGGRDGMGHGGIRGWGGADNCCSCLLHHKKMSYLPIKKRAKPVWLKPKVILG
jgi:hypothetical protein